MFHKTRIDNGLRLINCEMPHARSASVAVFVGVGSCHEQACLSGISHFIEHMLFKGTDHRPSGKEISESIEGVGGILNAEAGKEMTVYWAKVPSPHFPLAISVIADIILHSKFQAEEIEKERRVIVEELNMLMDTPPEWVDILFDQVMWEDQPLGRDIAGTKETVSRLSRDDILDFLQTHYTPFNAVVSVAGPLPKEYVEQVVWDAFGKWNTSPNSFLSSMNIPTAGPRLKVEYKETEQAHLCLGVPGYSYMHPDRFALDLLNVVLGEGMSSRLFQEIRERRALAYDVQSYVHHYRDVGSSVIYAGVEPAGIESAIAAILEQLERLKEPIPEEELAKAKELWKGRMVLRLEDTRSIASWTGGQELLLNHILTVDDVIRIVDEIPSSAINQIASELFRTEHLHLAVVGPFKDETKFARVLHL